MSTYSRRDFLSRSSVAVAGTGLGLHALRLPSPPVGSKQPIATFFPELVDADALRKLALAAIEVATGAGATYADVRIADRRELATGLALIQPYIPNGTTLNYDYSFGIRVQVGGAWGFAYGVDPTPESVTRAVQTVVATTKGLAKVSGPTAEMAPAPVVKGEWETPVQIDPFSLAPDEHAFVLGAYTNAAARVPDGELGAEFIWRKETRVFASSEGSLITQRLAQAVPKLTMSVREVLVSEMDMARYNPYLIVDYGGALMPASAGFEITDGTALQDRIKAVTEDVQRLLRYPVGHVDVGRYEVVFDGQGVGQMFGPTILPALELDRAVGLALDTGGGTFLAPPAATLGRPLFSPHLHVTADRAMPHYGAAKWDDEGVATEAYPLIEKGVVVDYFTSRQTAPALAAWNHTRGTPTRSRGAAVAWLPTRAPIASGTYVTISDSGPTGATLDDLTKELANGILVRGSRYVDVDQQFGGGTSFPHMCFEVKKGQITRRLGGVAMLFSTTRLWKGLLALGDASTTQAHVHHGTVGEPWVATTQVVMAPAAHFQQINVIDEYALFR